MKTIGVPKFREQCLALLDDLGDDGPVITKRGKPGSGADSTATAARR